VAHALSFLIEKRFHKGAVIEARLHMETSERRSVTVLFGPSGSGKTTILRCLAGLEQPEGGFIHFNEEVWFDAKKGISVTPQRRHIGFLFQEYALFPHLTVEQNIEYGLQGQSKPRRQERVAHLASLFQIAELLTRHPSELSGGQLQRVALARTVAPEPQLLLLDEPLSALDAPTRNHLRTELRGLLNRIEIPTLLVTHDRTEAIGLGDRLAVVVDGKIQQTGSVEEVFSRPGNTLVANSMGVETVIPGRILGSANGLLTVQARDVQLSAVDPGDLPSLNVHVCIRAEEVMLSRTGGGGESARNHLSGTIFSIVPEGPLVRVSIDCGISLVAFVTKPSRDELDLKTGDRVVAVVKATSVHLIPRTSGLPLWEANL
jgi:molybdate transport system ATP-binding protein